MSQQIAAIQPDYNALSKNFGGAGVTPAGQEPSWPLPRKPASQTHRWGMDMHGVQSSQLDDTGRVSQLRLAAQGVGTILRSGSCITSPSFREASTVTNEETYTSKVTNQKGKGKAQPTQPTKAERGEAQAKTSLETLLAGLSEDNPVCKDTETQLESAAEKRGLWEGVVQEPLRRALFCVFLCSEVIFSCKSHRNFFQKLPLQIFSCKSHRNIFQKLPLQCRHFLENPLAKNPKTQLLSWKSKTSSCNRIHAGSVQANVRKTQRRRDKTNDVWKMPRRASKRPMQKKQRRRYRLPQNDLITAPLFLLDNSTSLKTVTSLNREARLPKIPFFLSGNSIWAR